MKNYYLLTLLMIISSISFSQTINGQLGEFETGANPFDSTLFVTLQIRLNENESTVLGHAFNIKFDYDTLALQFIEGTYLNFNEANGYNTQPILRPGGSPTIQNIETKLISGTGQEVTDSWIDFILFEFKILDLSLVSFVCPHSNTNGFHFLSPSSSQDWTIGEWLCYESNVPVELTSFTASKSGSKVVLNWTTVTETNNNGFEILRSAQNDKWDVLDFVGGHGTTTESQSYSYVDDISSLNTPNLSYRLKQIDFDGSFEYSDVVYVENFKPDNFTLHQNFPNPFNPATKIKYSIPQSSNVVIKVFDILGNEIEALLNEVKSAGTHEITWNAEGLPSGIYFYQLRAGNLVETKKMVLLR